MCIDGGRLGHRHVPGRMNGSVVSRKIEMLTTGAPNAIAAKAIAAPVNTSVLDILRCRSCALALSSRILSVRVPITCFQNVKPGMVAPE